MHSYIQQSPIKTSGELVGLDDIRRMVRSYIVDSLLLGAGDDLDDDTSLIEAGILDSTGAMELVAFLEDTFAVSVADQEIVPENLDSVARICALIERKLA
jgi:acyl carrier protein